MSVESQRGNKQLFRGPRTTGAEKPCLRKQNLSKDTKSKSNYGKMWERGNPGIKTASQQNLQGHGVCLEVSQPKGNRELTETKRERTSYGHNSERPLRPWWDMGLCSAHDGKPQQVTIDKGCACLLWSDPHKASGSLHLPDIVVK